MSGEEDPIKLLSDLLRDAGARVTFDPGRTFKGPCHWCGTTTKPRDLVRVGSYIIFTNGGIQPRDALTRPVCGDCQEIA